MPSNLSTNWQHVTWTLPSWHLAMNTVEWHIPGFTRGMLIMLLCVHMCAHVGVCTRMCVCSHVYIYISMRACVHACMCVDMFVGVCLADLTYWYLHWKHVVFRHLQILRLLQDGVQYFNHCWVCRSLFKARRQWGRGLTAQLWEWDGSPLTLLHL